MANPPAQSEKQQPDRRSEIVSASPQSIEKAARLLQRGGLVAFPTETVYGLGANAESDTAVAGIYAAKQRPAFNPLIAHVASLEQAQIYGDFNDLAVKLAQAFWPGPLTLVVRVNQRCSVSLLARAGLDTLALRVPSHPVALDLLRASGLPIAAPSANPSGAVSPTTAGHVRDGLQGRVDMIVDGGPCAVGVESTILLCTGDKPLLLRPGGIAADEIEKLLAHPLERVSETVPDPAGADDQAPLAPGMLASHYAPEARVVMAAQSAGPQDAILDFSGQLARFASNDRAYYDLSPHGDLREAAANLFAALRHLDAPGLQQICVAPIPGVGLGEAINDRLMRAAAHR